MSRTAASKRSGPAFFQTPDVFELSLQTLWPSRRRGQRASRRLFLTCHL